MSIVEETAGAEGMTREEARRVLGKEVAAFLEERNGTFAGTPLNEILDRALEGVAIATRDSEDALGMYRIVEALAAEDTGGDAEQEERIAILLAQGERAIMAATEQLFRTQLIAYALGILTEKTATRAAQAAATAISTTTEALEA